MEDQSLPVLDLSRKYKTNHKSRSKVSKVTKSLLNFGRELRLKHGKDLPNYNSPPTGLFCLLVVTIPGERIRTQASKQTKAKDYKYED